MGTGYEYRITDVSGVTPSDIRDVNLELLKRGPYDIPPGRTKLRIRKEIRGVPDSDLERLFQEFPLNEPLCDQCALWFHAIAGNHYFPDANHRTAVSTLRELLNQNNLEDHVDWPQEVLIEEVKESKQIRRTVSIDLGSLFQEDEFFEHWRSHFASAISLPDS